MLLLDARQVRVTVRANDIAGLADAEDVRQTEIGAAFVAFGVQAGLKGRQERTSAIHVGAQLPALLVAEQSGVGKQQGRILS
jgi:hypothetical protein